MTEAYAFRELSLKSDATLKETKLEMKELGPIIKTEPVDYEEVDDKVSDVESNGFDAHFDFSTETKIEDINDLVDNDNKYFPMVNVIEEQLALQEENAKQGTKTPCPTRQMKAKHAWEQTKEHLIKECPYCFLTGLRKTDLRKHILEHVGKID